MYSRRREREKFHSTFFLRKKEETICLMMHEWMTWPFYTLLLTVHCYTFLSPSHFLILSSMSVCVGLCLLNLEEKETHFLLFLWPCCLVCTTHDFLFIIKRKYYRTTTAAALVHRLLHPTKILYLNLMHSISTFLHDIPLTLHSTQQQNQYVCLR